MNILTGETGSGKSIILGAFSLILGSRADSKVLLDKKSKCIVEATFDITGYDLATFFEDENLDYEEQVLIRREINSSGKSRAFINDTPVNLKQLQSLSSRLVDLHQQFENQGINDAQEQMRMLDSMAGNKPLLVEYRKSYFAYKELIALRDQLQSAQSNAIKQRDFVQFQLNELLELDLDLAKDGSLEVRLQQMNHAQDIINGMSHVAFSLLDGDQNVLAVLTELQQQLSDLGKFHPGVQELADRLESSKIELEDIAQGASQLSEDLEIDPEGIASALERMDKINLLLHKHQMIDVSALLDLQSRFDDELESYTNIDAELAETEKSIAAAKVKADAIATTLRKKRMTARPTFEKGVNKLLGSLKMEYANFKVEVSELDQLNVWGSDQVTFLFAPNRGSEHRGIREVASGGELSRLSLITKSLVAGSLNLPTLIFDEIDSGVSGDVAQKMGNILQQLSQEHQVISITHSPQVAARADRHFKVYKELDGKLTKAKIISLDKEERIVEIATMLSSSPPSIIAMESAKELIEAN